MKIGSACCNWIHHLLDRRKGRSNEFHPPSRPDRKSHPSILRSDVHVNLDINLIPDAASFARAVVSHCHPFGILNLASIPNSIQTGSVFGSSTSFNHFHTPGPLFAGIDTRRNLFPAPPVSQSVSRRSSSPSSSGSSHECLGRRIGRARIESEKEEEKWPGKKRKRKRKRKREKQKKKRRRRRETEKGLPLTRRDSTPPSDQSTGPTRP